MESEDHKNPEKEVEVESVLKIRKSEIHSTLMSLI